MLVFRLAGLRTEDRGRERKRDRGTNGVDVNAPSNKLWKQRLQWFIALIAFNNAVIGRYLCLFCPY